MCQDRQILADLDSCKPLHCDWLESGARDEYGFAITPQIAAEYRDIKLALRRLRGNRTATIRKAAKLRKRQKEIMHRLQCPSPSLYGKDQSKWDGADLFNFSQRRDAKITLSEEQDAAEAHCRARYDCYNERPEMAAQKHLSSWKTRSVNLGKRVARV